jgi:hypothetical protein
MFVLVFFFGCFVEAVIVTHRQYGDKGPSPTDTTAQDIRTEFALKGCQHFMMATETKYVMEYFLHNFNTV